MNKEQGIRHLLYVVTDIDKTSNHFRDYLNSGSKESWDQFVIHSMFALHFCQICDNKMLGDDECAILLTCNSLHDKLFPYMDYLPEKRESQEKVLEILWEIKKAIYPLTSNLLKEYS